METNTKIFYGFIVCQIFVASVISTNPYQCVKCLGNNKCQPPDCFCCRDTMPIQVKQVPQMVFFTFDDAIAPQVANFYRKLFDSKRKNPNGCPVKMTLFISHANTVYRIVREFYNKGMEIGAHSVSHKNMNKRTFKNEAKRQKENLARKAGVPISKIKGWRSPFLKPLGDIQPNTLKELGYDYDATLTIGKSDLQSNAPIPFTLDYGWPYRCKIKPCPRTSHKGFWEVPVVTLMDYKEDYECVYVDGCTFPPPNEDAAFKFLWKNFESYYNNNRAPFGINMHASWFYYPDRLRAMDRFIKELGKLNDVYIVSVSQVISWLRQPTPLSQIDSFEPWGCGLKPAKKNLTVAKQKSNPQTVQTTINQQQPKQIQQLQQWRNLIPGMSINNRRQESVQKQEPTQPIQPTMPSQTRQSTLRQATPTRRVLTKTTTDRPLTSVTTTTKNIVIPTSTPLTTTQSKVTNTDNNSNLNTVVPTTMLNVNTVKRTYHPTSVPPKTETTKPSTLQFSSSVSIESTTRSATSNVTHLDAVCSQEVNCFAPDCVCKTESVPGGLNPANIPQIVYITIDGDMNFLTYSRLRTLFSPYRKNPNGCSIRGTYFTSDKGLSFGLPHLARNGNIEIALNGMRTTGYSDVKTMANDIVDQIDKLKKRLHLSKSEIKGWRSPGLRNLGDKQFDALKNMSFYDSSLISGRIEGTTKKLWPFTLDYGWNEPCKTSFCPEKFHPGVWEVPIIPLSEHGSKRQCIYADSCYNQPSTLLNTYNYLWDNFQTFYNTNKAPFGIHLTQKWFQWYYSHNMSGLLKFLEKVASMEDVYVVSVSEVIEWIKNPTTLSDIKHFVPWKC
ncbi:hypothetical protein KUTeg_018489 [Tegillarca granosa]|uniref:NodB homology domain-containing protein n=1 Tax=Tegillarca granosa TaxID=220873 RepID=A0ABQ9EKJ0_TEGGR|nr:hypothetical protein KUTeg_018489 [Tegillarca granosa]